MRASSSVAVGLILAILAAWSYLREINQPPSPNAHPFPFDP
jgi:hypothetical protein